MTHLNDAEYLNTHQSETETQSDKRIQEINVIGDDDGRFPKEDTKDTVTNKTVLDNAEAWSASCHRTDTVFNLSGIEEVFLDR